MTGRNHGAREIVIMRKKFAAVALAIGVAGGALAVPATASASAGGAGECLSGVSDAVLRLDLSGRDLADYINRLLTECG